MPEQSFEKLKVWQKAHQLMLDIHHRLLPTLPKEEKYGLVDQLRRSSKSVGANIAEGAGRY
jgi:four helix bundle protein